MLYIDPSGHSYGTLPDGTKVSINSNWDAELFRKEYNRQNAKLNPTLTTKIPNSSSSDVPWWSAGQQSGITAPSEKIPGTSINKVSRDQTISRNLPGYERLEASETTANATYVYQQLTDKGWGKNAIFAVLGNMDHESAGINPGKWQGGEGPGYGLVQWDPASKYLNWAEENGYEADCITGQIEYLVHSMQPGEGEWFKNSQCTEYYLSYSEFITSNESVDYLTKVFLWSYERPSVPHLDERLIKGNKWKTDFGG